MFSRGQSALTRPIDQRGATIPATAPFAAFGAADSTSILLPPTVQCGNPGAVVDVTDVSSVDQDLYYEIRCPNGSVGWVTGNRLFGPLVLPATEGLGIIKSDAGEINLTETSGEVSDTNPVLGTCAPNSNITTVDFVAIGEEGERVPYYQINCDGVIGWVNQEPLLEIPYTLETYVIVVGDDVDSTVVVATDEDTADTSADEEIGQFLAAPLTNEPALPAGDNISGECPSGSTVFLEDVAGADGLDSIFYQVTCEGVTGWIETRYLPNTVQYEPDATIYFIDVTSSVDDPEQGYILDLEPSQVSANVGACALYQPVQVNQITFEEKALARLGYRLYYEVTCLTESGEEITGWSELELESDIITRRNPVEFLGN